MPDKLVLNVTREGPGVLQFQLEDEQGEVRASTRQEPTELQGMGQAMVRSFNQLIGAPEKGQNKLEELAAGLDALLPTPIAERLSQSRCLVELQCHTVDLPWQLASAVSSRSLVSRLPKSVQILESQQNNQLKAWVGHNPSGLEGWSLSEAEGARATLEALGFTVSSAQGRDLTIKGLSNILSRGNYGLVHLVLYATAQGLVLHDGVLGYPELKRLEGDSRPRLVCVHLSSGSGEDAGSASENLADALLSAGVPTVLVSAWNPDPQVSADLISKFYGGLQERELWQALAEAKAALNTTDDPYSSAHAFTAYGNWNASLQELRPVQVQTSQSAPTTKGAWHSEFRFVVLEGPDCGQEIPLFAAALEGGRAITIGRAGARQVDLAFEDESLTNHTASLAKSGGQLVLTNLSGSPDAVKVNGLPLYSPVSLGGWEEIRMGKTCLRFEPTSASAAIKPDGDSAVQFKLEVSDGVAQDLNSTFELPSRVALVGRQGDCAVILHDPSVSRHHLTLIPKQNGFFLSAIGEAQIVVNGFLLKGEHQLQSGDTIQLSPTTVLKFSRSDGS